MRSLRKFLSNIGGWKTRRKIVVFESDDWGSIRMPSKAVFNSLINSGLKIQDDPYCNFDSLERNIDLERLFDVISSKKDYTGNHPVFTALCLSANPDFKRIKENDFTNYHFESINDTAKKYQGRDKLVTLWKTGKENGLFLPQFHGREHLNVQKWMRDLKSGNPHTLAAFNHQLWGVYSPLINFEYQAAFDLEFPEDLAYQHTVIAEGIALFSETLGYSPSYFVPTNGPFNLNLESTLNAEGIEFLMLDKFQKEPLGNNKFKRHLRWLGQKNRLNQRYLSRNTIFEPSQFPDRDNIDLCLRDIEFLFKLNKPVTISTHRLNYIGALEESNSSKSLKSLKILLSAILKKWPDVEFMSSVELGELIKSEKS